MQILQMQCFCSKVSFQQFFLFSDQTKLLGVKKPQERRDRKESGGRRKDRPRWSGAKMRGCCDTLGLLYPSSKHIVARTG